MRCGGLFSGGFYGGGGTFGNGFSRRGRLALILQKVQKGFYRRLIWCGVLWRLNGITGQEHTVDGEISLETIRDGWTKFRKEMGIQIKAALDIFLGRLHGVI